MTILREEGDVTLLVFFQHILTMLIRLKTNIFCQLAGSIMILWGLKE